MPGTPCELSKLALDRGRLARIRQAACILAGESEVAYLRLCLHEAGYHAPPAANVAELILVLIRAGWAAPQPYFSPPQTGSLFVQATAAGEVLRVGMVGAVHRASVDGPVLRDYFRAATDLPERGEQVEVASVSFWLLPPGSVSPIAPKG